MPSTTRGVFSIGATHSGAGKSTWGARPRDVGLVDLRELGVAVAAGIAVVGRPIGLRRHQAVAVAGLSQQADLLVVGAELEVGHAFGEDLSFESGPVCQSVRCCERRSGARRATSGARCADSAPGRSSARGRVEGGHSAGRDGPMRRNAASSIVCGRRFGRRFLGPDSPPVASPPWQRAQRLSYSRPPASGVCAQAAPSANTATTEMRSIRILERYQVRRGSAGAWRCRLGEPCP